MPGPFSFRAALPTLDQICFARMKTFPPPPICVTIRPCRANWHFRSCGGSSSRSRRSFSCGRRGSTPSALCRLRSGPSERIGFQEQRWNPYPIGGRRIRCLYRGRRFAVALEIQGASGANTSLFGGLNLDKPSRPPPCRPTRLHRSKHRSCDNTLSPAQGALGKSFPLERTLLDRPHSLRKGNYFSSRFEWQRSSRTAKSLDRGRHFLSGALKSSTRTEG